MFSIKIERKTELQQLMETSQFFNNHLIAIVNEPNPVRNLVRNARDHVERLLDVELRRENA